MAMQLVWAGKRDMRAELAAWRQASWPMLVQDHGIFSFQADRIGDFASCEIMRRKFAQRVVFPPANGLTSFLNPRARFGWDCLLCDME